MYLVFAFILFIHLFGVFKYGIFIGALSNTNHILQHRITGWEEVEVKTSDTTIYYRGACFKGLSKTKKNSRLLPKAYISWNRLFYSF